LTPDSFSGDGVALSVENAIARIDAMIADGAHIIDIGAESTRPGAVLLNHIEELQRIAPILEAVEERKNLVQFSIDTRHAATAQVAIKKGVAILNDVSAASDPQMLDLAREYNCKIIIMHNLGIPADPQITLPQDCDVVQLIYDWAENIISKTKADIIIDVGIGFGKTHAQAWKIIRNIDKFKSLGVPIMVAHSRKSFLSIVTDKPAKERDFETLQVSSYLVDKNVDYIRVHDVKSHSSLLKIKKILQA